MPLRVYNTLSRKKEAFVPLHGKRVSMFVCGITPQDQTHLGHAKTYVAFDVVARYLRSKGYHVFYLQNVTDIEDRIIAKMKSTRRAWDDIVAQYFAEFRDVMERLQCTSVDVYAFATDYIDEIVEQIQGLIRKGHAYVAEDKSVYFDTTTFSGWGKLSGQKVEELRPGARIEIEERKRHPADFVLWRAQKPGEPAWESPWGPGRPGWHIEDTAITIRHFGVQYDLHGGMVMVSGAEMHKSLGNFWPVQAALERYEPEVLRFFLINVQYRGPIDFAPELLEEAKRSYERLRETVRSVEAERRRAPPKGKADPGLRDATKNSLAAFDAAMSDDFNTREAIAVLFEFARDVNKAIESGVGRGPLDGAAEAFRTFGDVLGLFQMKPSETDRLDGVLDLIVGLREDARKRKDFATADRIRDALAAVGIVLEDARDGVRWKLK